MATMVEIKFRSICKELEKLNSQLERAEKRLVKAEAEAVKKNAMFESHEAYRAWLDNVPTDGGWIINKADIERNGAYRAFTSAQYDVKDLKERIEKTEKRFEKAQEKMEDRRKAIQIIEDQKQKEELMKLEFEEEQKEWAKDGITLEERYRGITPRGKRFLIRINRGFTERAMHCFTLYINYEVIFTSGEFWRAYAEIKKR